jgi:hypothetical protein
LPPRQRHVDTHRSTHRRPASAARCNLALQPRAPAIAEGIITPIVPYHVGVFIAGLPLIGCEPTIADNCCQIMSDPPQPALSRCRTAPRLVCG